MGGNCDTGSSGIEIAPASVIRIATTVANTGRSMKKATKPGARGAGCGGSEGADTDLQQRRRKERAPARDPQRYHFRARLSRDRGTRAGPPANAPGGPSWD